MAQQHAIWKAQALAHWKEFRPQTVKRLQASGTLDSSLDEAAQSTSQEMQALMNQGATWDEAWQAVRENHLFPHEEPGAVPEAPASAGYRTAAAVNASLGSLAMPGEKE